MSEQLSDDVVGGLRRQLPRFIQRYLLCWPNKLRCLTWIAMIISALAAARLSRIDHQWSDTMERHRKLGFAHGGNSPTVAIELAQDSKTLRDVLLVPPDLTDPDAIAKIPDVINAKAAFNADYFFLIAYAVLFGLLAARQWKTRKFAIILIALTAATAVFDGMENRSALGAMDHLGTLTDEALGPLRFATLAKWTCCFTLVVFLGGMEVLTSGEGTLPTILRSFIGLLLLTGGLTGLSFWLFQTGQLIENGMSLIVAGLLLVPLFLWNPDKVWN